MRVLIQRVTKGSVIIDGKLINQINQGFVILLGVKKGDGEKEALFLSEKTVNLRVMSDSEDKMNLSILETGGEILVISQFTLIADMKAGRRPSFINSADPREANHLYALFIENLKKLGVKKVVSGVFGAYMTVEIINDGPVTILLDSDDFNM